MDIPVSVRQVFNPACFLLDQALVPNPIPEASEYVNDVKKEGDQLQEV